MLVRTANMEGPDLGLCCLSRPFWKATSVQNFRTFTLILSYLKNSIILSKNFSTEQCYGIEDLTFLKWMCTCLQIQCICRGRVMFFNCCSFLNAPPDPLKILGGI